VRYSLGSEDGCGPDGGVRVEGCAGFRRRAYLCDALVSSRERRRWGESGSSDRGGVGYAAWHGPLSHSLGCQYRDRPPCVQARVGEVVRSWVD